MEDRIGPMQKRQPAFPGVGPRVDAREKVTGRAKYIEDLPDLPGMAYAAALRSPYSHARILSIDSSRAEQLPGVYGVVHREHQRALDLRLQETTTEQSFVATDKARFDGDLVAMVAAVDQRTARRAVELIDVDYEVLPPVFSTAEALAPGAPLVHEETGSNLAVEDSLEWGDVERAMEESDRTFEESFASPTVYHHPMEPATSFMVNAADDGFDFWVATNHPYSIVGEAVEMFGVEPERVRVRVPYVGGNFGAKDQVPDPLVAAALARKIRRPVKLVVSAEESFRATCRHAMVYRAKIGVKSDGTIAALDVALEIDTGAYFTGAGIVTTNAVTSASGAYRVPNFRVRARTAYTNKVPAGPFRNTGKNQTTFGIECALDSVARRLGVDPVEFRRRNVLLRGEYMTPRTWKRDGVEGAAKTPPVDTDLPELLRRAVEAVGWDSRAPRGAGVNTHLARGRGVALSIRRSSQIGDAEAMATLDDDGVVTISHNAPDVGEGSYTIISVVAAGTLGLPPDQIRVGEPDTGNNLYFSGTNSQRTTVQMGGAVQNACEGLKRELIAAAARAKGGAPEEWQVAEGRLCRGEVAFTFSDIVRALPGAGVLRAKGSYKPPAADDITFGAHDHWSPGAAAAEVEVDRETGEIRVLRYAAVADAGRALHPGSAKGQIDGGAVMGLGITAFEELCYRDGQLQNADPFQYRLPVMKDIPESFHSSMLERGDGPGPFGSKSMAQVSIPCVAPAIGNAIYDAIGVRLDSTPFSPEKILRALARLGSNPR